MVKNTTQDVALLKQAYDAARERARVERTSENMRAAINAWNALEAATPRRRPVSARYASRAGRRQHAEQRAAHRARR